MLKVVTQHLYVGIWQVYCNNSIDDYPKDVRELHRNGSVSNNGTVNRYDITPTISTDYIKSRANGLSRNQTNATPYLQSRRIKTCDKIFPISVE